MIVYCYAVQIGTPPKHTPYLMLDPTGRVPLLLDNKTDAETVANQDEDRVAVVVKITLVHEK